MNFVRWLWARASNWKTIATSAFFFLLALGDMSGAVDVRAIVGLFLSDDKQVAGVMALMSALYFVLRMVSPFVRTAAKEDSMREAAGAGPSLPAQDGGEDH